LIICLGQLATALGILARRVAWQAAATFISIVLLLVVAASLNHWLFALFLGETPSFGFILLGLILLSTSNRNGGIAIAALCFSAAISTKLIAVILVGGIATAWLWLQIRNHGAATDIVMRTTILALGILSLPIMFEVVKFVALGPAGYRDVTSLLVHQIGEWGVLTDVVEKPRPRLMGFLNSLSIFIPSVIVGIAAAVSAFALLLRSRKGVEHTRALAARMCALAAAGTVAHFGYLMLLSDVWRPRYFWIGIAIGCVAIAAPVLSLTVRDRAVAALAIIAVAGAFGLRGFSGAHREAERLAVATQRDRLAVLHALSERRSLPVGGRTWISIADVLFEVESGRVWAAEPDIERFRHTEFVALLNTAYDFDSNTRYFAAVTNACAALTPGWQVRGAYQCNDAFWTAYRKPSEPL
jgi:hypothetical protein